MVLRSHGVAFRWGMLLSMASIPLGLRKGWWSMMWEFEGPIPPMPPPAKNYVATNPLRRPYVLGVGGVRGVPLDSYENMPFVVWVGETLHMYTWGIANESWGKLLMLFDVDVLKQSRGEKLWKVGWTHIVWFCFMHGQCRERSKIIKMMFFKSPNPTWTTWAIKKDLVNFHDTGWLM